MKALDILQNDLAFAYPKIHSVRLNTLFTFVGGAMRDQRVTVTYLGRGLKNASKTDTKHDIKRADRLIGNTHLHNERLCFYEHMTEMLVGQDKHPLIIVDWSPINGDDIFQILRASIPMGGRALTLYEKVYPESELNTETAHQALLDNIERCLPADCQPIILSDAIFKTPWFKAIEEKNWYWVGRVRGNVTLSTDDKTWYHCKHWYKQANGKAANLGEISYSKATQFKCSGTLYQGTKKGREKKKMRGGKSNCTTDKYYEKKAKEPWLLIFNLPDHLQQSTMVVKLYKQRMQIEENFRDTKNGRVGISLEYANSKTPERFDNLLLVAALTLFALWCMGYVAALRDDHLLLQANSIKHRAVLSYIYLGREVVDDDRYRPSADEFVFVYSQLYQLTVGIGDLA